MIVRLLILVVGVFSISASLAADTYRWEDEQGNVHYSDQSPPAGARNITRTRIHGEGGEEPLPYRLQLAVDKAPVTLYVTDCGRPCRQARELLVGRGVPHTLLDASRADVQESLKKLTGGELEVPVIAVGATVVRGFEEGQWNAALDTAGYPSYPMIDVAPYRPGPPETAVGQDIDSAEVATGEAGEFDATDVDSDDYQSGDSSADDSDTAGLQNEDAETGGIEQEQ